MSKPLPILPHMPWNVKKLIVDSSTTTTKLALRPCSKDFNNLFERTLITYQSLSVKVGSHEYFIRLGTDSGSFIQLDLDSSGRGTISNSLTPHKIITWRDECLFEVIVEQSLKLFRNPKVLVQNFEICISDWFTTLGRCLFKILLLSVMKNYFTSLNRQVAVEAFQMSMNGTEMDILDILPYLKPGTLKSLVFSNANDYQGPTENIDLSLVAETEQWKAAEHLTVERYKFELPIEKWSHFTEVKVLIPDLTIPMTQDILKGFVRSVHWKKATLLYKNDILQELNAHFANVPENVTVTISESEVQLEKTE